MKNTKDKKNQQYQQSLRNKQMSYEKSSQSESNKSDSTSYHSNDKARKYLHNEWGGIPHPEKAVKIPKDYGKPVKFYKIKPKKVWPWFTCLFLAAFGIFCFYNISQPEDVYKKTSSRPQVRIKNSPEVKRMKENEESGGWGRIDARALADDREKLGKKMQELQFSTTQQQELLDDFVNQSPKNQTKIYHKVIIYSNRVQSVSVKRNIIEHYIEQYQFQGTDKGGANNSIKPQDNPNNE